MPKIHPGQYSDGVPCQAGPDRWQLHLARPFLLVVLTHCDTSALRRRFGAGAPICAVIPLAGPSSALGCICYNHPGFEQTSFTYLIFAVCRKTSDLLSPSPNDGAKDAHLARFNIELIDELGPSNVIGSFGTLLIRQLDIFSETNHSLPEEDDNMTIRTLDGSSNS